MSEKEDDILRLTFVQDLEKSGKESWSIATTPNNFADANAVGESGDNVFFLELDPEKMLRRWPGYSPQETSYHEALGALRTIKALLVHPVTAEGIESVLLELFIQARQATPIPEE